MFALPDESIETCSGDCSACPYEYFCSSSHSVARIPEKPKMTAEEIEDFRIGDNVNTKTDDDGHMLVKCPQCGDYVRWLEPIDDKGFLAPTYVQLCGYACTKCTKLQWEK